MNIEQSQVFGILKPVTPINGFYLRLGANAYKFVDYNITLKANHFEI